MARKIQQAYSLEVEDIPKIEAIRQAQLVWFDSATASSAVRLAIRTCADLIRFGKFDEVRAMIRQLKIDAGIPLD